MLDEGVVAEAQDIDLCMLLGAGWPFHLGGITPYLDRTGTSERVTGSRFLAPGRRQRRLPSPPAMSRGGLAARSVRRSVLPGSPSRRTRRTPLSVASVSVIPQGSRSATRSAARSPSGARQSRSVTRRRRWPRIDDGVRLASGRLVPWPTRLWPSSRSTRSPPAGPRAGCARSARRPAHDRLALPRAEARDRSSRAPAPSACP